MPAVIQTLSIAIKELREWFHRPWQAVTLILGPLALLIIFGTGSDPTANPPRAIVVVPPGQGAARLLENYRKTFEQFLDVADYTEDEAGAIEQLRDGRVEAVFLLPPRAYETISAGEAVSVTVLYNQLDPLWRHIVPTFINRLAGQINHTLLVETIGAQQATLADTVRYLDLVLAAIDLAIAAADQGDQGVTRERVRAAHQLSVRLEERLAALDPEAESLLVLVGEVRRRLAAVVAGLLGPLGVPLLGSPWRLALVIVTLTLASVGLGFVLSLLASSERQAVQFAMLALLAVVFFSGFAMPLEALHSVALLFSYAVPATYGVGLLREVMLGGTHSGALDLAVLAAIAVGLSGLSLALLIWRTRPD